MHTFWTVLLIILIVVVAILVVLFFVGRKLQSKQIERKIAIEAAKQTVTMLVIDKKRLKIADSGLPKLVYEQTPLFKVGPSSPCQGKGRPQGHDSCRG